MLNSKIFAKDKLKDMEFSTPLVGFMSKQEKDVIGNLNLAGSTNGGEADSISFAKHFLYHPILGHTRQNARTKRKLK